MSRNATSEKTIGQRSACWVVLMTLLVSVIGEGGVWAQQVQSFTPPAESEVEYYHTDVIGSVRLVTNQVGQVTKRQDFSPYGTPLTDVPSSAQPRGFAGKERDDQTGFDYFGGRYLLSNVSRFTTVDPVLDADTALVDPQRWNRYTYVANRPLVLTDPDGRCPDACVVTGPTVYIVAASVVAGAALVAAAIHDFVTSPEVQQAATATKIAVSQAAISAANALRASISGDQETPEVAPDTIRTPTDRLAQHLSRSDLVGAAREVATGVPHGGQHRKEVTEAARGLRNRIDDINQGLSNPRLTAERRRELEKELGIASRFLDEAEKALRGDYPQHAPR